MRSLSSSIYYERVKKLNPKFFVVLLLFLVILFIAQLIFVYFKFIPTILQPYDELLEVKNHISYSLDRIIAFLIIWPIVLFGVIGAMIHQAKNIQKLIMNGEEKQKAK